MESASVPRALQLFLVRVIRQWQAAKRDPSAPWPNRCFQCRTPLMCPHEKFDICSYCSYLQLAIKECAPHGWCPSCNLWDESRVIHDCVLCECPLYDPRYRGTLPCTCEPYIRCVVCGGDADGGPVGHPPICSRACLRY